MPLLPKYEILDAERRSTPVCMLSTRLAAWPTAAAADAPGLEVPRGMVYVRGLSAQAIAHETGLRREQVLRAVLTLRRLLQREVPPVFQGTVEIDEAYVGSRWRNCRQARKALGSKHGRGTSKIPVFGILCRGGQVWAQGVPDLAVRTLFP